MGDEELRSYFERAFPEIEWRVITAKPLSTTDLPRLAGGVRSLFSLQWLRTLVAFARADAIVFGGGTLFADHESVHACFLWYSYVFCARLFRVPLAFAFQGVGPFRTFLGRFFAGLAYRSASFISVRDDLSFERTLSFRPLVTVHRTIDPVFPSLLSALPPVSPPSSAVLAIVPRQNSTPLFFDTIRSLCSSRSFSAVHLLFLQEGDDCVLDALQPALPPSLPYTSVLCRSAHDILSALLPASLVCTQRYHGALAALALEKETIIIPQMVGDKLDALQHTHLSSEEQHRRYEVGEQELRQWLERVHSSVWG